MNEEAKSSAWNAMLLAIGTLLMLALASWFATPAHAGHRVCAVKQVVQTQFVAVPVAVPLGYPTYVSPVANAGMVAYGPKAEPAREAKSVDVPVPPSPDGVPYEEYLRQFASYLAVKNAGAFQPQVNTLPQPQADQAPKVSLVQQHCASCHNATKQEGKLDLTAALSSDVRLRSIQRLLTDDPAKSMPRGKTITDQQRGELISEISGNP